MSRLPLSLAVGLLCIFALASFAADEYEYGTPADLRGLTIYYVDSGSDVDTRNEVAAKLRQETTRLQLAGSREEAQISIDVAGSDRDDDGATFLVYVAGKAGRPRLIRKLSYTHSKFPR